MTIYDAIGKQYASTRRPDPRIASAITLALGKARTITNVGAGTGSYEPAERFVVAIEPSTRMIAQRPAAASHVVRATSEALPVRDGSFDAALAILTVHHWDDWRRGIAEMRRVARRIVVFTFDPELVQQFWLVERYFPEIAELDRARTPPIAELKNALGDCSETSVPVPHDCTDGFLAAFWRRPEVYLDPAIRAGMSGFALLDPSVVERGVARLTDDLRAGTWNERYGYLRDLESLDVGYRLLATP